MGTPVMGGASRKTRQTRRAVITFALALALLGGAFYKAYDYMKNEPKRTPTTSLSADSCPLPDGVAPANKVTVNVYNATTRTGLAAAVAADLKKRGFIIGEIDNDPLDKKVTGVAEIRYGTAGTKQSKAVALVVKGNKLVKDKRKTATIDLAIGEKYVGLVPVKTCKPASASPTSGSKDS